MKGVYLVHEDHYNGDPTMIPTSGSGFEELKVGQIIFHENMVVPKEVLEIVHPALGSEWIKFVYVRDRLPPVGHHTYQGHGGWFSAGSHPDWGPDPVVLIEWIITDDGLERFNANNPYHLDLIRFDISHGDPIVVEHEGGCTVQPTRRPPHG